MKTQAYRKIIPILIITAGLFLLLVSLIYLFIKNNPENTQSEQSSGNSIPYPEIIRITPKDAKVGLDSGEAIIIDVRGEPYFSQLHIQGAISITEKELLKSVENLDPNQWIITYCT